MQELLLKFVNLTYKPGLSNCPILMYLPNLLLNRLFALYNIIMQIVDFRHDRLLHEFKLLVILCLLGVKLLYVLLALVFSCLKWLLKHDHLVIKDFLGQLDIFHVDLGVIEGGEGV